MSICVLSASLGGFDNPLEHVEQTIPADYFTFTDENFPTRDRAITPRLQAKIPKMFGYQLKPGYDAYLWLDGNITLSDPLSLNVCLTALEDHDIVVFKHPRRPHIFKEGRYIQQALDEQSNYAVQRYENELLDEQLAVIRGDPGYVDDLLLIGGVFMYRNTPEVQAMLKEWWYHVSRYITQDQLSFPYVLKRSPLKVKIIDDDIYHSQYFKIGRHKKHG